MASRARRLRACGLGTGLVAVSIGIAALGAADARPGAGTATACGRGCVRIITIRYRTHSGLRRPAYVVVPRSYRPGDEPLPLVISPHGRGVTALAHVRRWGGLPALGPFAVVSPAGHGRRLGRFSWGFHGQITDLARMPGIVRRDLPWLKIDRTRIYAFGTSMGGQEALLLLARYWDMLAGVAAFDSVTDMARQYRGWPRLGCNRRCRRTWTGQIGHLLQELAGIEIGGSPSTHPGAYARRSPMHYARGIARSGVPLQLWWSTRDRVVAGHQSRALLRRIWQLNGDAPVEPHAGEWRHSAEMNAGGPVLRAALLDFGLLSAWPA